MPAQLGNLQLGNAQLGDGGGSPTPPPVAVVSDDSRFVSSYWFYELPLAIAVGVEELG